MRKFNQAPRYKLRGLNKKLFKIMRITCLTLTVLFTGSFTLLANRGEGQSITDTRLSLRLQQVSLKEALNAIEKNTVFRFIYNTREIAAENNITLNVKDQPLNKILDELLHNRNFSYKDVGNNILIKKESGAFRSNEQEDTLAGFAGPIKGRIVNENGEKLPGVTITVKSSGSTAVTDEDGSFLLTTPDERAVLVISFVGYKTKELTVTGRKEIVVQLEQVQNKLDEVVVVGYTQQKRSSLTGALSSVSSKEMADLHGVSFNEKIQGLAPGLQISSNSGVEGGSALVRLRGATSINAGNDPLYVIDGVFLNSASLQTIGQGGQNINPLADINPNDIETVQVLKDANATAIYGARGANGVILITTKRGSRNGRTRVNFNSEYGLAHYDKLWKLVTGPQHAEIMNEAYINDGGNPATRPFSNPDSLGTYDRLHLVFRTGTQLTDNISVQGGNEKTRFYLAGDFINQQSILKLQDFRRLGFRINVDHTINRAIQIGISTTYSNTRRTLTPTGDTGGILNTGLHTPTLTPIIRADGTYNNAERFNNPYILFDNNNNHAYGKHLISNAYFKWNILPNLSFKSSWSLDDNNYHEFIYYNANLTQGKATNGSATDATTSDVTWIGEQVINYNTTINKKHFLSIFAGNTLQKNQYQSATVRGTNFPSTQFTTISAAAITSGSTTGVIPAGLISYFGGVNYSYENKYIADLNLRADASSRFGSKHQWGQFPSAGLAWRISQEDFFKNSVRFIDELKIKGSIGWTGNQNIANFASLGLWSGGNNYQDRPGTAPSQLSNPDLKWETTRQWNLGIQSALLNNKIKLEFNYYDKSTTDLLLQVPIPGKTGFSSIFQNLGAMSNKGFEFEISSTNISSRDFEWTTTFNISHNENIVTKLPTAFTQYNRSWVRLQQGYSMYSFWLYKQLSVDPQTGNAVYQDLDKNGKITTDDRQIVGNAFPKYFGGLRNSFSYKNVDLNFFVYFSQGNKVFNMNRYFQEHAGNRGTSWSMQASMLQAWQKPGDITNIPRITNLTNSDGSLNHNFESSRFMEDGSFVRLRNITLGYTLPQALISRIGIQRLRAYINVTNLFTITSYSGADPEVNTAQDYANQTVQGLDFSMPPHPRTIDFGLNLTF
jgi:TonB-linked SusC/RagA family outer membrane protein